MNVQQSYSETSDIGAPQLYLLQMDSSYNLNSYDPLHPHVLPLPILNNSSNYGQTFRLKQKQEEGQSYYEVLIDVSNEAVAEQKHYPQETQQFLSPSLQNDNSEQLPIEVTNTEFITPSLTDSHNKPEIENKEQSIQNYVHISDRSVVARAFAVIPSVLQIRNKDMIWPRRTLPTRTRFGPVQGIKSKISDTEKREMVLSSTKNYVPLFMLRDKDNQIIHIDTSDKDKSNWIGLLPLGDELTANLWIYEENNELYVITTEPVPSRKQLMLGYSSNYARDFGLVFPCRDIVKELSFKQKLWWCYTCERALPSALHLKQHLDADHEDDVPLRKRTYRCRYCSKTFARVFTLRRHVASHCEKKLGKSNVVNTTESLPEPALDSTLNTDDNRVPSDESFQNYSNGLDFSTNLFDTDRMPSLDISGNSRSEVFNPYSLDAEPLTNDLGYVNGCSNKAEVSPRSDNKKKQHEKNIKPPMESCTYCNQDVVKGKKRQHVSECPARRFECECKKVFTNKKLLESHIYREHSNETEEEQKQNVENTTDDTTTESQDTAQYLCEQCQHAFKRRGMLVNHLWRVHGAAAARVPLARRVRHYPCGVCPKIYRTAAKRDRHVTVHHPGVERSCPKPMEGGTRLCAPAACAACPRQYATRAKLLQHQRYHHPHLVPPPKKKKSPAKSNKTNDRINNSEELLKSKTSLQHLLNFY